MLKSIIPKSSQDLFVAHRTFTIMINKNYINGLKRIEYSELLGSLMEWLVDEFILTSFNII